ncbi:hypothetical protein [Shimazuella alba]|uniref:Uncharacterized protein n=1 Tax=Shimazuella alba TaxID=2690964 RepID=A0A6I4VWN2_9BACL|nr:hypothetical protein [Shimazuella alba]MXQ52412.1 hypothetical protein [Shimazuella alba]
MTEIQAVQKAPVPCEFVKDPKKVKAFWAAVEAVEPVLVQMDEREIDVSDGPGTLKMLRESVWPFARLAAKMFSVTSGGTPLTEAELDCIAQYACEAGFRNSKMPELRAVAEITLKELGIA